MRLKSPGQILYLNVVASQVAVADEGLHIPAGSYLCTDQKLVGQHRVIAGIVAFNTEWSKAMDQRALMSYETDAATDKGSYRT